MNTGTESPNRREFLKGPAVGVERYALGVSFIHPEEDMGQTIEADLEKVQMDSLSNNAASGLIFWSVSYLKEVYDNKGREQYLEYFKKNSPLRAAASKRNADRLGFTGSDAKSAVEIIPASLIFVYGPKQKYETVEATAEKARVQCINCELWNHVQATKITDDLCSVHSQYWWDGFVKGMNPKMTSTLVKARPRGDSVCEWVVELQA